MEGVQHRDAVRASALPVCGRVVHEFKAAGLRCVSAISLAGASLSGSLGPPSVQKPP